MTKKINGYGNFGAVCDRMYGLLGLAAKKGSVISGADACAHALKNARASKNAAECGLLIIAGDASDNTRAKFSGTAPRAGVEVRSFGTRAELGRRTGKAERSVLIVTDSGLAAQIAALIDESVVSG